ncbi:MAG: hypothetical protein ACLRJC_15825 [Emergencia timonensis]|uniref:hypothetical protein n=1 Tax=Emergencia timonensis TaxID=1776384 RepID=UPI00083661C1|nr:hypothetical protein [Emergencia timonensis]WNX87878.1 hypothetical protein RVY71_16950 [Emergencia timonensis]
MQILVAISIYGFILWPCMFVFGLASGITRKISGNEHYYIPLIIAVFGLIMTLMPLYAHAFA